MEVSETLKNTILKHENEIDKYQFEGVYSELEYGEDVGMFTEMMLDIGIDPAEYLGYIPSGYLCDSKIEKYNIPNGATSIEDWAFSDCSRLTSITIPDSVTRIGYGAFSRCSRLMSVTVPDSVVNIREEAFEDCNRLVSITIGNGVKSIGKWAFSDCSRLTSVTIRDGVESIEWGAFSGCNKLKDINYRGTIEQWKKIKKEEWTFSEIKTHCIDGDI